jgi:hypothetical protein
VQCWEPSTKSHGSRKLIQNIKTLFYFNSAFAWPYTSYTKAIPKWSEQKKTDILLKDYKTGKYAKFLNNYVFDIIKSPMRTWWSDTVSEAVSESHANGLFLGSDSWRSLDAPQE